MTQKNRVNKSVFVFVFRAISLASPSSGNRALNQIGRMRQNGKLICHISLGWRGRARFNPNLSPRTFFWPLVLLSARVHYSISLTRNGTVCEQGNRARRNFQNIPIAWDFFAFLGKRKQRFMQKRALNAALISPWDFYVNQMMEKNSSSPLSRTIHLHFFS